MMNKRKDWLTSTLTQKPISLIKMISFSGIFAVISLEHSVCVCVEALSCCVTSLLCSAHHGFIHVARLALSTVTFKPERTDTHARTSWRLVLQAGRSGLQHQGGIVWKPRSHKWRENFVIRVVPARICDRFQRGFSCCRHFYALNFAQKRWISLSTKRCWRNKSLNLAF